ncbi:hypothetical protein B0H19DRAFT_1230258 [Mycena capillaripes]|nr:hypothetical protein B0H19DRAFT_1230258 [Mycena capillaripes]
MQWTSDWAASVQPIDQRRDNSRELGRQRRSTTRHEEQDSLSTSEGTRCESFDVALRDCLNGSKKRQMAWRTKGGERKNRGSWPFIMWKTGSGRSMEGPKAVASLNPWIRLDCSNVPSILQLNTICLESNRSESPNYPFLHQVNNSTGPQLMHFFSHSLHSVSPPDCWSSIFKCQDVKSLFEASDKSEYFGQIKEHSVKLTATAIFDLPILHRSRRSEARVTASLGLIQQLGDLELRSISSPNPVSVFSGGVYAVGRLILKLRRLGQIARANAMGIGLMGMEPKKPQRKPVISLKKRSMGILFTIKLYMDGNSDGGNLDVQLAATSKLAPVWIYWVMGW